MVDNLSELQIINYYKNLLLDYSHIYCIECGLLLIYLNANVHILTKKSEKGNLVSQGLTFLSTRIYDNYTYRLCRCRSCVESKFPVIKNRKSLYTAKFARYTLYAFNVPDEIFNKYTKIRLSITLENMIKRYGELKGLLRWLQYCDKQRLTNTFEYKAEHYGMSFQEFQNYNRLRACTLDNFINRYGEMEGNAKWEEYKKRLRYTTSRLYFIETYGDEIGDLKFKSFEESRLNNGGYSLMANKFFDYLVETHIFDNDKIYYNGLNHEYEINGYRVDFYDKTKNLVIEFYGDYWHRNPKLYNDEESKQIQIRDKKRISEIQKLLNCKIFIVWESDMKSDIEKIIYAIKNLIA